MTLHERVTFLFNLRKPQKQEWQAKHPRCPNWLAAKIVAAKIKAAKKRVVSEVMAEAAKPSRLEKRKTNSLIARVIYTHTGLRDARCREAAKQIEALRMCWGGNLENLPHCPEPTYWDNGYGEDFQRRIAARAYPDNANAQRWYLFNQWVLGKAIAESNAEALLKKLNEDTTARISGYLADCVISWQSGRDGDYEGCSGCEHYMILKTRPETWALLLSRAPIGAKSAEVEQTFPHEKQREAQLRADGWVETMRMSDSIWSKNHPLAV